MIDTTNSNSLSRAKFLQRVGAAAAGFYIVPRHVLGRGFTPPSDKLNIAGIGIGGQGGGLMRDPANASQNIVALCDVDWKFAANTAKANPKAERFDDYRVMLEKVKGLDAVIIATPDHMHAPISVAAMRAGKHVYVEKPMAHTIEETRVLTRIAKETGLVTQMGNNGHGKDSLRQTREWIQAGIIGTVKEVHSWSDRPGKFWKQDLERPTELPAVPETVKWDLWLGAAPQRPYHPYYHPRAWRGWFDFGTGALGDMAVHNMDPAFYALDLDAPVAAESQCSPIKGDSYPAWQIITWEFAARGNRPAVKVYWYDGGKKPKKPAELEAAFELGDNGIYFVGDKGTILCGGWSAEPCLVPQSKRDTTKLPPPSIPRSIGHRAEWVQACKDRKPEDAKSGFSYSGPFTEALLVGNLATRLGKRIEWDAANMRARNAPEADAIISKRYRSGFGI